MATNGTPSTKTPARARLIAALLDASNRDVAAAAKAAGVPARTAYRWMGEPAFRANLHSAEEELLDGAVRRLVGVQADAVAVIVRAMADSTHPPTVRLRAALAIIDVTLRLREQRDLSARIAALEALSHDSYS